MELVTHNWMAQLANNMTREIFAPEERRLLKSEVALTTQNLALGGKPDGFRYQGHVFSNLERRLQSKAVIGNLHPSLALEADGVLRDRKVTAFDKSRVHQGLVIVLMGCRTYQDVYDALPNSLHELLKTLVTSDDPPPSSRTREEAWTIRDNPRSYAQYLGLRTKIEFYNISKLLY